VECRLKGNIYVESHLNQGSQFVCLFPLKCFSSKEEPVNARTHQQQSTKKYGLVVEDQPIAALVAKTLLLEQGCEIDLAENGITAINQAQKHVYDFILMDIGLPDLDGFEVARHIRLIEENTHHRAFIAGLTAHAKVEKQHALAAGIDLILTKPLTQEMATRLLNGIFQTEAAETD